ncbi:MAG: hypothetical protein NUW37_01090 [Planctomycetes bacterium]|nr:hypothetical protein [Planctomycetota bacterium]
MNGAINFSLLYIDPAVGTVILSAILSAVIGSWLFFRNMIERAFRFCFGWAMKKPAETEIAPVTSESSAVSEESKDGDHT